MSTKIIMPKVDMVMESGTFLEWLKKEGDQVEKGDAICIIESDKAAIEVEAPAAGILAGLTAKPNEVIPVTNVIGYILAQGESLPQETGDQPTPEASGEAVTGKPEIPVEKTIIADQPPTEAGDKLVRATPLARSLARELQIDLSMITGRGERGRIYRVDVEAAAGLRKNAAVIQALSQSNLHETPVIPVPDAVIRQRIPLSGPRAIIAQRMSYSASVVPHIYESVTVEADQLYMMRESLIKIIQEKTGQKLTYTGILTFILSRILPRHPFLNSSLIGEEIIQWEDINIGLATDMGEYLIVPVIRQAQMLNLIGITAEIGRLLEAARTHKLSPDKMRNGTFTISNLGMFGIDSFTAIINPPEAAILSVGRIKENPISNGKMSRTINLVLGADHRIVDGAKAARFLMDLKTALENPFSFLVM